MNDPFLPEELRLFIACTLPEDWTTALQDVSRTLSKGGLGQLRWVQPEGIHLTLKFLGDVGRHLLPDLNAALQDACLGCAPLTLRLDRLGSFGGRRGVRVLWAGVQGDLVELQSLHSRVDAEVAKLGFAREIRPFSPHLTIARVPEAAPADVGARIVAALRSAALPATEPFTVAEVSLVRSQLGPGGARYTSLAAAALRRT
jgi:2'-5' RNA ligase